MAGRSYGQGAPDLSRCPYCGKALKKVTGKVIYPTLPKLHSRKFMHCFDCWAYVGCHEASGQPLGFVADADLRKLRQRCHVMFDEVWKSGLASRKEAYTLLAGRMGIDGRQCHFSFFDLDMAGEALVHIGSIRHILGCK